MSVTALGRERVLTGSGSDELKYRRMLSHHSLTPLSTSQMVNWQDPEVQFFSAHISLFVAVLCVGIYLWEFLIALWFDLEFLRQRRSWRWTLIPYMIARYAALAALIAGTRVANVLRPIDTCSQWWQTIYVRTKLRVRLHSDKGSIKACANIAMACGSLLLILRVVAVSGNKLWVRLFLIAFWLADVGVWLRETVLIRGVYVAELVACGTVNTGKGQTSDYISLSLYVCCLVIVTGFLLRTPGAGLVNLLISQGVIYFAAVLAAYVPAVVLFALDLNDGISGMLQPVSMVVMVICATRMYRSLVQYDDKSEDSFAMTSTNLAWGRNTVTATQLPRSTGIIVPPGLMESSIDTSELDDSPATADSRRREKVGNNFPRNSVHVITV
ncbi:hypothetical protein EXIGLDRAFT_832127 [Exidia glandulosa HHB12029]|uniref:Transmembrane protein n=1 Tax=Exidia glandulosa HHB12029 TaxID=1314781 RepID=A0A165M011_EXIGL|nr:hypothetical protein EXIGLDRAFT_832127 [Exidia glandulosa HHB12029]